MADPTAPPTTATTTTSTPPAPPGYDPKLWTQAVAAAQRGYGAAVDPLNQQLAQNQAQGEADQAGAIANAQALSELLKGIGPSILGAFTQGANETGILGKGFSTEVQNQINKNSVNINDLISKAGGTAGQMIDPQKAADAADVLFATGGFIPGTTFAKQGAGFAAAADMLPATALLKGQENAQLVRMNTAANAAKIQQNIAELASQIPGNIEDNYSKLAQLALDDKKFQEQLKKDQLDAAYKRATLKMRAQDQAFNQKYKVAQFNQKNAQFAVTSQQSQQRINLEAQRLAQSQFNADRSYQLSLARLGVSQKSLQLRIAQQAFKVANGGYSQKELEVMQTKALGYAQSYLHGSTSTRNGKATTYGGVSYFQALTGMLKKGMAVQVAVDALDQTYPQHARPTPQALAAYLGPLTPDAIKATVDKMGVPTYAENPGSVTQFVHGPKAVLNAVQLAKHYLGTPYLWGGENPKGFDCSGLLQYVWGEVGVNIPRTTYDQFKSGRAVATNQLRPGDAVFFRGSDSKNGLPGHVGMYLGNGKFIEAPHTGSVVRISTLAGRSDYMGARRFYG